MAVLSSQQTKSECRQVHLSFRGRLGLLLKGMQDVHGIGKRDVKHAKGACRAADANFPDTRPNVSHRLPIGRIKSMLHLPKFYARLTPRPLWKVPNSFERIAQEDHRLHSERPIIYQN
jgi:hypothetical protein